MWNAIERDRLIALMDGVRHLSEAVTAAWEDLCRDDLPDRLSLPGALRCGRPAVGRGYPASMKAARR